MNTFVRPDTQYPRCETSQPDGVTAELEHVGVPVALELAHLVRRVEALDLHGSHGVPPL